jgi:hypothetical protein
MKGYLKTLKKRGWINEHKWECIRVSDTVAAHPKGNRTNWNEDQAEPKKFGSQRNLGLSWNSQGLGANTYIPGDNDE